MRRRRIATTQVAMHRLVPATRWASTAGMSWKLASVACIRPNTTVPTADSAPATQVGPTAPSRNLNGLNRTSTSSATARVRMPSGKCTIRTWKRPRNQMN